MSWNWSQDVELDFYLFIQYKINWLINLSIPKIRTVKLFRDISLN